MIRYLFAGPLNVLNHREQWGLDHLDLVEQTASWWAQAKTGTGTPAPSSVLSAWRALYRECWTAQADVLLSGNEAVRTADPRLCQPAAVLADGALVDDRDLQLGSPIDGRAVVDEAMAEHERRRSAAVARALRDLPLHRRLRTERADLEAAYDAEHLFVCPSCAVPCNDEAPPGHSYHVLACRCCGGALVRLVDAPVLPPTLAESLERIAARRTRLSDRR